MEMSKAARITLASVAIISASLISIKIFEVHFHFNSDPDLYPKVERLDDDRWLISLANNGLWLDTGINVPIADLIELNSEGEDKEDIEHIEIKIGEDADHTLRFKGRNTVDNKVVSFALGLEERTGGRPYD